MPEFLDLAAVGVRVQMSQSELASEPADPEKTAAFRAFAAQYARVGLDGGELAQDVEWAADGNYLRGQKLRKLGAPNCVRYGFDNTLEGVEKSFVSLFAKLGELGALRAEGLRKVREEISGEVRGIEAFLADPAAWCAARGTEYGDWLKKVHAERAPAYLAAYGKALARVDWEISELDRPE